MDPAALYRLLDDVRSGACSPDGCCRPAAPRWLPFADLGTRQGADHHRSLRQGFPEAVYGPGKTAAQCSAIVGELLSDAGIQGRADAGIQGGADAGIQGVAQGGAGIQDGAGSPQVGPIGDKTLRSLSPVSPVLLTRADDDQAGLTMADHPGGSRTITGVATGADRVRGQLSTVVWRPAPERSGRVLVITAGTSDLPVARECEATLQALGFRPDLLPDCGVAGIHRLLASADTLAEADAVVVVAGNGRCAGQPGRRHHAGTRRGRPYQHGVRRRTGRRHRAVGHARFVRRRRRGGGPRQRVRRCQRSCADAAVSGASGAGDWAGLDVGHDG